MIKSQTGGSEFYTTDIQGCSSPCVCFACSLGCSSSSPRASKAPRRLALTGLLGSCQAALRGQGRSPDLAKATRKKQPAGWLSRHRSQRRVRPHSGGCGCRPSPSGQPWAQGWACGVARASLRSTPADRSGLAVMGEWAKQQQQKCPCGPPEGTPPAWAMPAVGEARAEPVKIMGYAKGQGFPPSSACCLKYSASPRHYFNEILFAVYFSRGFFCLSLFWVAISHPSQTNSKAKFSLLQR